MEDDKRRRLKTSSYYCVRISSVDAFVSSQEFKGGEAKERGGVTCNNSSRKKTPVVLTCQCSLLLVGVGYTPKKSPLSRIAANAFGFSFSAPNQHSSPFPLPQSPCPSRDSDTDREMVATGDPVSSNAERALSSAPAVCGSVDTVDRAACTVGNMKKVFPLFSEEPPPHLPTLSRL